MNPKTYLLSFLMMDIYNNHVLKGSPPLVLRDQLNIAMDFVEQASEMMKLRKWDESLAFNAKVRPVEVPPVAPYPGLRNYVVGQSPTEHPLPISDASGTA